MSLTQVLQRAPARSIEDAFEIMADIDRALTDTDGIKWFNRLYLRVTEQVGTAVATFNDAAFMTTLDVVFANLYFSALTSSLTGIAAAPSAWRPLLQARNTAGIARIQFALAGMNAHINRDLPDGIVQSFLALGGDPITDDLREKDFDSINDILERVEQQVKGEFTTGVIVTLDRAAGPVDDAIAMWKVRKARRAAWVNAQVLWGLGGAPRLRDKFFDKLDGLVGMAGRGLLVPHPSSRQGATLATG